MPVLYYCPRCEQMVDFEEHECYKRLPTLGVLLLLVGSVGFVALAVLIGSVV